MHLRLIEGKEPKDQVILLQQFLAAGIRMSLIQTTSFLNSIAISRPFVVTRKEGPRYTMWCNVKNKPPSQGISADQIMTVDLISDLRF